MTTHQVPFGESQLEITVQRPQDNVYLPKVNRFFIQGDGDLISFFPAEQLAVTPLGGGRLESLALYGRFNILSAPGIQPAQLLWKWNVRKGEGQFDQQPCAIEYYAPNARFDSAALLVVAPSTMSDVKVALGIDLRNGEIVHQQAVEMRASLDSVYRETLKKLRTPNPFYDAVPSIPGNERGAVWWTRK